MSFESRYKGLNTAQKKAVDTIDGPVMVIAGPGTGKTELLSMRTANILRLTDTSPSSILCITYTDNGAAAIRNRLIGIIGQDAYKVPIHTFHSFGLEIINQNPEYFYNGAQYRNTDDLTKHKILDEIFQDLPHSDMLASRSKNGFTYLHEIKNIISEIKKSGLTGSELLKILDSNELTIQKSNVLLNEIFSSAPKINMSMVHAIQNTLKEIENTSTPTGLDEFKPLADILVYYLQEAMENALNINKTKPMTEWRNTWMIKDSNGSFELKSTKNQQKLRSACAIYEKYLSKMDDEQLFDYDDMIMRVVHASNSYQDLKYNLQEKFQYIMIDEFQDTNIAQMRLVSALTDTPIDSDKPNIMIVGDDDQAIYSFQGADVSNIINFSHKYPGAEIVTLTENYRSTPEILKSSRKVILNGNDRLENHFTNLNKELRADKKSGVDVKIFQTQNNTDEKLWLVDSIKNKIIDGIIPKNIAVLTRKHEDISNLIPYFSHAGIPFSYERKNDVLKIAPILWLLNAMRIVYYLKQSRLDKANELIPEFIAHKSWAIKPEMIFNLSLKAYQNKITWIEALSESEDLSHIYKFLIEAVSNSVNLTFESFIDFIMGKDSSSPFISYFFSIEKRTQNPEEYITFLNGLSAVRKKFRDYLPNNEPNLEQFLEFIELHQRSKTGINLIDEYSGDEEGVRIMTAHSSKGLEYDTVYIFNTVDTVWGRKARAMPRTISYPENMPLKNAGEKVDEQIRLLYVAMTRAKNELLISYSTQKDDRYTELVEFLVDESNQPVIISMHNNQTKLTEIAEINWYKSLIESKKDLKSALSHRLQNYQLSSTHFNNFLDITRGGPENFLLNNLLKFPQSKSPNSAYGSAVHEALKLAHEHLASQKNIQPTEDILNNFEKSLRSERLSDTDFAYFLKKGRDNLAKFLDNHPNTFKTNQIAELDFNKQQSLEGEAKLTGKIDVFEINDNKTSNVIDYKTGKSSSSWDGKNDAEKIKLHKYRQQLIFYKIMVESSRDFFKNPLNQAKLIFVEPNKEGKIDELSISFNEEEIERTKLLIKAVWNHIMDLNIPDTSVYRQDFSGIRQFEDDLLENRI